MTNLELIEKAMYAIMEASTDEVKDLLMLWDEDDTEIDEIQEHARHIWKQLDFCTVQYQIGYINKDNHEGIDCMEEYE